MTPHAVDLFGEVAVTADDVRAWLRAVPRLDPDSPRARWYVDAYDVPAKIRAAKLAGTFESITAPCSFEPAPFWWQRFRWG